MRVHNSKSNSKLLAKSNLIFEILNQFCPLHSFKSFLNPSSNVPHYTLNLFPMLKVNEKMSHQ